jgi:hypothetical protein
MLGIAAAELAEPLGIGRVRGLFFLFFLSDQIGDLFLFRSDPSFFGIEPGADVAELQDAKALQYFRGATAFELWIHFE